MADLTVLADRITDHLCEQDYDIGGRDELLRHVRSAIETALCTTLDGCALVPAEPDAAMVRAGMLFGLTPNQASTVYQSMLLARPQGVR